MRFNGQNKKPIDPRYFLFEEAGKESIRHLQELVNKWFEEKDVEYSIIEDGIYGGQTAYAIDIIFKVQKLPGKRQQYNVDQLINIIQNIIAGKNPTEELPAPATSKTVNADAKAPAPNVNTVPNLKGKYIISAQGSGNNFAIIYGGLRSGGWSTKTISERLKKQLTGKNVIYSDFENSIDSLKTAASQSLGKDINITLLLGWSRGGKTVIEAMPSHPEISYFLLADPSSSREVQTSQIPFEKSFMSLSAGRNGTYAKYVESQFKQLANGGDKHIIETGDWDHWKTVSVLIAKHIDKFPS